jgi:hypothetical protein
MCHQVTGTLIMCRIFSMSRIEAIFLEHIQKSGSISSEWGLWMGKPSSRLCHINIMAHFGAHERCLHPLLAVIPICHTDSIHLVTKYRVRA